MAVSKRDELAQYDRWFVSALDHPTWIDWRRHARKCFEYRDGDQWTAAELAELQKRGQPPTVNNQVRVTVDRMIGQFVSTRTRIGFRGRNPDDTEVADLLSDALLFIRQNTHLEFEERDVAEDGFTGGFGCLEGYVSFDDAFQPDIRFRHCDPFEIFPDPWSRRYDWNEDAQFIIRARWLTIEEARARFPKYADQLANIDVTYRGILGDVDSFKNDNYFDYDSEGHVRRVRIAECWFKVREQKSIALLTDPSTGQLRTIPLDPEVRRAFVAQGTPFQEISRTMTQMKVAVFTGGLLLSRAQDSPHGTDLYPFVPYYVLRRKNGEPYSLVYTALPLQDAINKRESKALHLLNSNRVIYETGAVTDKNELATEIARPDGQVEVRRFDKFLVDKQIDVATSQMAMHEMAKGDFRRVSGINPEALGERSEIRSGVGIQRKQAMTDVILSPVFDQFRRARTIWARLALALIQNYWTEEKVFLVTDDLGKTRNVKFGGDLITRSRVGIYDVVIEELPDTTTIQEQQFQQLGTLLPQILPFGPMWAMILLQMSNLRNKDDIIKEIQQMSQPPPPDPKFSIAIQWNELTPEEKVAWAGRLGMPALAQAQEMSGQPSASQRRQETEIGRERIRAMTEMRRQQLEARTAELDSETKIRIAGMKGNGSEERARK